MGNTEQPNHTKKVNNANSKNAAKKKRKPFPKWAGIVLVTAKYLTLPVFSVSALVIGLFIGYSYLGGQNAADIVSFSTWKHLYDLVFAQ